jgi:hypothetical protein
VRRERKATERKGNLRERSEWKEWNLNPCVRMQTEGIGKDANRSEPKG